MNALEIGQRLVELARADKDEQALDELYADSIVSVEVANPGEGEGQSWEGIAAVKEKHAWWNSVATLHSLTVEGPYAGIGDDQFAVKFAMDITMEEQGRSTMAEVGVYRVANGKIVHEAYLPLADG